MGTDDEAAIENLLGSGCSNLNAQDANGNTPMMIAIQGCFATTANGLYTHANNNNEFTTIRNKMGLTAFDMMESACTGIQQSQVLNPGNTILNDAQQNACLGTLQQFQDYTPTPASQQGQEFRLGQANLEKSVKSLLW